MTYTINRFDSTKLVDVEDGTTNNAYTPLRSLVGMLQVMVKFKTKIFSIC